MSILVSNLRLYNNANMKAFADVTVNGVTLRDCRVVQQNGQRAYASFPVLEWENAAKQKCRKTMVECDSALKAQIMEAVMEAYSQKVAEVQ